MTVAPVIASTDASGPERQPRRTAQRPRSAGTFESSHSLCRVVVWQRQAWRRIDLGGALGACGGRRQFPEFPPSSLSPHGWPVDVFATCSLNELSPATQPTNRREHLRLKSDRLLRNAQAQSRAHEQLREAASVTWRNYPIRSFQQGPSGSPSGEAHPTKHLEVDCAAGCSPGHFVRLDQDGGDKTSPSPAVMRTDTTSGATEILGPPQNDDLDVVGSILMETSREVGSSFQGPGTARYFVARLTFAFQPRQLIAKSRRRRLQTLVGPSNVIEAARCL